MFLLIGHAICFAYPGAKIRILSDIFTIFASWRNKTFTVIKRALKIIWLILVAVTSVVLALVLAVQTPAVQTSIAEKAVEVLSEKINGDITFERIHFKPFTTLVLKNVVITDKEPIQDPTDTTATPVDTFFRAQYIIVNMTLKSLTGHEGLHFDKARIADAEMNLVLEDCATDDDGKTDNLSRIFGLTKPEKTQKSDKELFHLRRVVIDDFTFRMKNYSSEKTPYYGGISWNDLDIDISGLKASELQFKGGVMSGEVDKLAFTEKAGFVCHSLTGKATVGNGKTIVEDLKIKDEWSDIDIPLYMMSYADIKSFNDYIALVRMDAELRRSIVDFRTIEFFAPQLEGNRLRVNVKSGKFYGTVDDFFLEDMEISSEAGGFAGIINGRMTGIPEIESTVIDARVKDFSLTSKGLGTFVSEWMTEGELDLSKFAPGTAFRLTAHAHGLLNQMNVEADIRSAIGGLHSDIILQDILTEGKQIGISGTVRTDNLNVGKVIGTDLLGETSLIAIADVKLPEDGIPMSAVIDSLNVDRMHIYGYDYTQISGDGDLSKDGFDGRITCNDPNLNFMFHGRFGLSPRTSNTIYKFYAIVGHANLNAMNIDKRGKSEISLRTSADFRRTSKGDIYGDISIDNIILENAKGKSDIGEVKLTSVNRNDTYRMWLKSGFANGTYTGTAPVTDFIKDLGNITLKREIPALFTDATYEWNGNRYSLDFDFVNMQSVLDFAMPGMYIARNTTLSTRINDRGRLTGNLKSQRIAFGTQYIRDLTLDFNNNDDSFNGELRGEAMEIASLQLFDNSLRILADDNHIGLGYTYDNQSELENRGEFFVHGDLARESDGLNLDVNILPSMIHLNSREWRIQPSHMRVNGDGVDVTSVEFISDGQSIDISGRVSRTRQDTLTLNLNRFDISVINPLLGSDFGIKGAATGSAQLTSPLKTKGLLADILCDSTYLAGKPLGIVTLASKWDEDFERFDINVRNELNGTSNIEATGKLTPKTKSLEATARLNRLDVGYVEPVLKEIFSDMEGYISGEVTVDGPLNAFEISSNGTRLDDGMLRIAYTNVPYYADGTFHLDQTGVYFDDIKVRDRYTGTGSVGGSINWNNFKDIYFDARIKVNEIEGINLNEKQGESFYGNIFGTGNVSISGPINSLVLNVDAVTAKTGELHIPIASATTSGSSDLLKFTEIKQEVFIDPYEVMISRMNTKNTSANDFLVNLHINANPDVTAFVEIDKASGHMISGRGNGTIELVADEDLFTINGDYTLTGGSYKFVALGLVNRDFEIQDGSSVTFNGDLMETSLDIDALYKTKASLSTLISDTTSVANRRTVECGISITDKLANPRLGFSIEIPELDPTIKSRVESALSTEDKVQKQFLSILLSNSFLPDEQSGIFNNSTMLYSNVAELMSNQLSNILQKLNIPVDLGLNYQPNEKGNDVFDVAVSTQMFNNRVVVNGSVGNKQYSSGGQADVVGDLDIEIKLDRSGAFRLNLFSHSADTYTNYLDNSQRNGVGLTYQTEFNSLGQFFKNMFSSKKKRQEAKRLEEQAMIDGEKVTINITE